MAFNESPNHAWAFTIASNCQTGYDISGMSVQWSYPPYNTKRSQHQFTSTSLMNACMMSYPAIVHDVISCYSDGMCMLFMTIVGTLSEHTGIHTHAFWDFFELE